MADNRSSYGLPRSPFASGYGGVIPSVAELPVNRMNSSYTVDGSGTISRIVPLSRGTKINLYCLSTPTFTNSSKLICPSATNYTAAAGDLVEAISLGDGVWQIYVLPNSAISALALANTFSALNTFNAGLTVSGSSLTLSGNQSAASWTTNGIRIKSVAATFTDTTSSGTVAAAYTSVLGGNTIAASSATVFTNYFSFYLNAPIAGTNVTLTNSWALGADSLKVGTSNPFTVSAAGAVAVGGTLAVTGASTLSSLALSSSLTLTASSPTISLAGGRQFNIDVNSSIFRVVDITGAASRFQIATTGEMNVLSTTTSTSTTTGALTIGGGLGVAGDIFASSLNTSTAPTAISGAGPFAIGSASTLNKRMKVNLGGTDYWIPVSTTAY